MMIASIVVLNLKVDDTLASTQRIGGLSFPDGPAEGGNYLIIGSDSRAFVQDASQAQAFGSAAQEGGQRSDTMMVLHIDPATKSNLLVSFPRDLLVNIPGQGRGQINGAFNSGPQTVIDLMKDDFGIQINHYVEINFEAFIGVVDAVGKIPVYFPYPARDTYSGLNIPAAGLPGARRQRRAGLRAVPPPRVHEERALDRRQSPCRPRPHHAPAGLHPQARVVRVGQGRPEPARRARHRRRDRARS